MGGKLAEECGVGNSAMLNIQRNAERNLKFVSDLANEDGRSEQKMMRRADVQNAE